MNKSTFFNGQPIFSQLLRLIPREAVKRIALEHKADRYCKRFSTYEHLVTMLYSIFNNCNSLREVTTGMLATEQRLTHIGLRYHPRRSTISDANNRRKEDVFARIYFHLYNQYSSILSDSRTDNLASKLYIIDSTTISLFQEVLRGAGYKLSDGKRKGGIKVHTLIRSDQDVPCMIRFSAGTSNDSQFLREVHLPKGSVIVFDRGYYDFTSLNRFDDNDITWVSRLRNRYTFEVIEDYSIEQKSSILSDTKIKIGWIKGTKVIARLVRYKDEHSGRVFEFICNNFTMKATTIAELYKKRWQIELLFKRMKQNYPLKYFLGDSENAIKLQIWCSLIADLLLQIIKKSAAARWSFSNLASMVRLHLMTYIDLFGFLKSPEKALVKKCSESKKHGYQQLMFKT